METFNKTLRMHELIINKLSVERRGLIDYMHHGMPSSSGQRHYDGSHLIPQDRICIRNLNLGKIYPGKFILCRIITGSYQMTSVITIVEDPLGNVERLCLNNWCDQELAASMTFASRSFIPIGTIVAIQNPAYVMASDGNAVIRLDKPSDLVVMNHHHPIFYGLSWMGERTRALPGYEPHSPKLKRYVLTSEQTSASNRMMVTSGPSTPKSRRHTIGSPESTPARTSGMNLLLTPPSSGSAGKSLRRLEKKKAKRGKQKRQSLFVMLNHAGRSMSDKQSASLLAFCLFVFVWYLFLA